MLMPFGQIVSPSLTTSRTILRGLREEIGSWKIICNLGLTFLSASPFKPVSSIESPSEVTITLPDVGLGSCTIDRAVVDLPHPDSPTIPSVSPFLTSKLTSETA